MFDEHGTLGELDLYNDNGVQTHMDIPEVLTDEGMLQLLDDENNNDDKDEEEFTERFMEVDSVRNMEQRVKYVEVPAIFLDSFAMVGEYYRNLCHDLSIASRIFCLRTAVCCTGGMGLAGRKCTFRGGEGQASYKIDRLGRHKHRLLAPSKRQTKNNKRLEQLCK